MCVCSWSVGGCVAYALLANHHQAIDNVIIASGSPGGPNAYLPPPSVLEGLRAAAGNYTALLPFLFPNGARDDGVCALFAAYNSFYRSKYTALEKPLSATVRARVRACACACACARACVCVRVCARVAAEALLHFRPAAFASCFMR